MSKPIRRVKRRYDRPFVILHPDGTIEARIPGKVTARKIRDIQALVDFHTGAK